MEYGLDVVSDWSTGDTVEINGEKQQILSWYTGDVDENTTDGIRFHQYVVTLVIVPYNDILISDFRIYEYENQDFVSVHQSDIVAAIQPGKYV